MTRKSARVLRMGLQTLLGIRRQGYFVPYRYADQVPDPADAPAYDVLRPLFAAAEPRMRALLAMAEGFGADLARIAAKNATGPNHAPPGGAAARARFDQSWFPRLDAVAAYTILRSAAPRRVVEVGSGHSTRFMARAIADGGLATDLIAFDPAPRADISEGGVRLTRKTLQQAGLDALPALGPGDVVFIDSSHLGQPGSDVDLLINHVLPALPAGVKLHIHDILLPDPYPKAWGWRGYAEQVAVAPLLHCGGYRLLWSSPWAAAHLDLPPAVAGIALTPGALETSLWVEKTAPAVTDLALLGDAL